jgi:signal peptidase I
MAFMDEPQYESYESFAHRHRHSAESIVTLLEWLLVAFILALVFQGFAVQAFQIPTGSMAETLRGAHHPFRCFRCGFKFDMGKDSYSYDRPQCPNCSYNQPPHAVGPANNGDRIFVLKSIYQFFEPKRWDVVVFKNPTNPRDNYIKRLIGLPGETIQLINGDVYIDGRIVRKPLNVQNELWMPIFVQDYQPLAARENFDRQITQGDDRHNQPWEPPFVNESESAWDITPTRYILNDTSVDSIHTLAFQTGNPHEFKAAYAYNNISAYSYLPVCSDLMITFYARAQSPDGTVGASLEKFGVLYSAQVNFNGTLVFTRTVDGVTTTLGYPMLTGGIQPGTFQKFEFANVDQQLVLRWGDKRFAYDLARDPVFQAVDKIDQPIPAVKIFAAGPTDIRHVGLYRDIYYQGEGEAIRATVNKPFALVDDQFFVCGDNANNSSDGRLWSVEGIGNNGTTYRQGIVPREYMMGKAVMVYWSQAFKPTEKLPPMLPNLGNIKVIYGGSEQQY